MSINTTALVNDVLGYWFGPLDDNTELNRKAEPFATLFQRWYGKDPAIDAEIRERFEPALAYVTGPAWPRVEREVVSDPRASLAITILCDQLPRNMYRNSRQMYAHDDLVLAHAYRALSLGHDAKLSLVERMFACVPLMHAENLTLARTMEAHFVALADDAEVRSPHNAEFYAFALAYARRHRIVIERFGRFPHRNAILERESTTEEAEALRNEDLAF